MDVRDLQKVKSAYSGEIRRAASDIGFIKRQLSLIVSLGLR